MQPTGTKKRSQSGCGFLLGTFVLLVFLLLVNIWVVRTFGAGLLQIDTRLFQAAQFLCPLVMIFVEYWIYDMLVTNRYLRNKTD